LRCGLQQAHYGAHGIQRRSEDERGAVEAGAVMSPANLRMFESMESVFASVCRTRSGRDSSSGDAARR
jgi:hypothetical protein